MARKVIRCGCGGYGAGGSIARGCCAAKRNCLEPWSSRRAATLNPTRDAPERPCQGARLCGSETGDRRSRGWPGTGACRAVRTFRTGSTRRCRHRPAARQPFELRALRSRRPAVLERRQVARQGACTAELALELDAPAEPVLCRSTLQAAGRAAGHRHQRQGRHGARRLRPDQSARRAHHRLEGADRAGARARLSVAHPPAGAGRRRSDDLQPQPLRGRAGAAGQRLDRRARRRGSATRTSTTSSAC